MNYRMLLYIIGKLLLIVGLSLLLPLGASLYFGDGLEVSYLIPIAVSVVLGIVLSAREPVNKSIYVREGFIIVAMAWVIMSVIGGLPFYISRQIPSFIDCFFETVSGFTTTGATIMTDVERMSKSLLFWRSFTHWLGGMGILVLMMAIFSARDTRTTHVMNAEMPGPAADKLASKWQFSVRILYVMYISLTLLETALLMAGGMPLYDSLVHAFGTAGTGGFGIKNSSVGYYNSAYIDYVIAIFMMMFGVNLNIYYLLVTGKLRQIGENSEFKWYIGIMLAVTAIVTINILPIYGGIGDAFRYAFFQVSSVMTTTGYSTTDFNSWPMLSKILMLGVMCVGGCVGSTAGGMKVMRFMVLVKAAVRQVKRTVSPRRVITVKVNGKSVGSEVLNGILAYFVIYIIFMALSIVLVSLDNFDFTTTVTAVVATFNNIGPGLGMVGPAGNFSEFSALSKLIMSFGMLAGRLELYPILMLFLPNTWKRYV